MVTHRTETPRGGVGLANASAGLIGAELRSADGEKAGFVSAIFHDKATQRLEWLGIRRAPASRQVLVPAVQATFSGGVVRVPHSVSEIDAAPQHDGEEVDQETERALAAHYGLVYSEQLSETGLPLGREVEPTTGQRAPGSGRASKGRGRRRSDNQARRDPSEPTRGELYAEARRLDISGRSKMNKQQLARAVEKEGRATGRSRPGSVKANPVEVQAFLEAVKYPVRKADLVREAKRQGASDTVAETLERIRDEKFDDPTDVSEAIGRLR